MIRLAPTHPLRIVAVTVAAFGLMAMRQEKAPLNLLPDHADDVRWTLLDDAKLTTDIKRGVFTASFPDNIRALDGKTFDIGGYMLPLAAGANSNHFILTRRSPGCPFCPPNEPTEAIEVFTKQPVRYDQKQFFAKGRLKLVTSSTQGLFYRMEDASVS